MQRRADHGNEVVASGGQRDAEWKMRNVHELPVYNMLIRELFGLRQDMFAHASTAKAPWEAVTHEQEMIWRFMKGGALGAEAYAVWQVKKEPPEEGESTGTGKAAKEKHSCCWLDLNRQSTIRRRRPMPNVWAM